MTAENPSAPARIGLRSSRRLSALPSTAPESATPALSASSEVSIPVSPCEQLRTVGLAASAHEKLAKLLLDWTADGSGAKDGRVTVPLTHEEIAECIGSSRETVTRTFSEFKSQRLVTLKGSTLYNFKPRRSPRSRRSPNVASIKADSASMPPGRLRKLDGEVLNRCES